MDPKLVQQLSDLYQQLYKNLTADAAKAMAKAIPDVVTLGKEINRVQIELNGVTESFEDISSSLKGSIQELSKFNVTASSTKKSFKDLQSIAQKLSSEQSGFNNLSEKELKALRAKAILNAQNLKQNIRSKELTSLQAAEANDVVRQTGVLVDLINKRLEQEKKINAALGISGTLIKGMSSSLDKLGMGGLLNIDEINEKVRQTAETVTANGTKSAGILGKAKVLGTAVSETFSSLGKGLKDPAVIFTFLITQANKADKQTTQLAKSLMQTKGEAMKTREQFVGMANASGDAFINTDKLIEANAELSKQLGFNKMFSQDMNQTFVDLTKKIGLSEEAAGGLAKVSIATGKTLKSTEQTIAGVTSKISAQNGIQLDGKEILEESGKVSGQLLANFKGNPGAIAEAVAQTKVLGTTLEQTKGQADKLLDFESSIGNQLKAELLTGQQLNLERARAAALQGDQATVAKELASQNVNFNKFSKMNVIQQNALAESLGLSSDQLSDQLLKQEAIGKSRSEIVALGGEEAAKRLEALSAQDKFNAAVQKMQDLFGNLVAGPLGMVLDVISDIAGLVGKIIQGMQDLMGNTAMKALVGAIGGFAVGGPMGALIGGVGGLVGGLTSSADDMVGYGARTLSTPTGTVALNNNDTVIAGTNLFKGDDVMSFPKGKLNLGGGSNSRLEDLMSTLIDVTKTGNNKQIGIDLDGRAVGTGIVRATYQSA